MTAALAILLAAFLAAERPAGGAATAPARVAAGRYVLSGTARVDVTALSAREYPLDVLALVAPGDGGGAVRLHLWSRGYACELLARLSKGEALVLAPGQTCRIELAEPDQRGRIDATLRSGSGRLARGELALRLAWDVSGSASLSSGGRVTVPGTGLEVEVPASPPVPLRGTVEAEASGPRETPAASRRPSPR